MSRSPRSNVRRLAVGRLISVTGGAAAYTALMFTVWDKTHSATWQSVALLLTFGVVYVTDDYFASDIFNGELPGRALIGQLLRGGHWPVWTTQLCSGLPLAGSPADPLGLALFSALPPAPRPGGPALLRAPVLRRTRRVHAHRTPAGPRRIRSPRSARRFRGHSCGRATSCRGFGLSSIVLVTGRRAVNRAKGRSGPAAHRVSPHRPTLPQRCPAPRRRRVRVRPA